MKKIFLPLLLALSLVSCNNKKDKVAKSSKPTLSDSSVVAVAGKATVTLTEEASATKVYKVYYKNADFTSTSGLKPVLSKPGSNKIEIPDLTAGTYYFAITLKDGKKTESGISNRVQVSVPAEVVKSSKLTLSAGSVVAGVGKVTVTLPQTAVVGSGNVYKVYYKDAADFDATTADDVSSKEFTSGNNSVDVTGLTAGTEYHFAITLKDGDKAESELSNRLTATPN